MADLFPLRKVGGAIRQPAARAAAGSLRFGVAAAVLGLVGQAALGQTAALEMTPAPARAEAATIPGAVLGAVSGAAIAAATPAAPRVAPPAPIAIVMPVSLRVDGALVGEIEALVTQDGQAKPLKRPLFAALQGRVSATVAAGLNALPADAQGGVELAAIKAAGVEITYDSSELAFLAQVPAEARDRTVISLQTPAPFEPDAGLAAPRFALSSAISLAKRVDWDDWSSERASPLTADWRGALKVGGISGATVTFGGAFNSGSGEFSRAPIRVVRDDWRRAIRTEFGEVDPAPVGLQQLDPIRGVSIARRWGELAPTRNVRPSGQTSFTLERDAQVEIFVNNVRQQSLGLRTGRYDLKDFMLQQGANDVRLEIEDEGGRREVASFSAFLGSRMLAPGVTSFTASAGEVRDSSQPGRPWQFAASYERGFARATVGADLQVQKSDRQAGGSLVTGTPLGELSLLAAYRDARSGSGAAVSAQISGSGAREAMAGQELDPAARAAWRPDFVRSYIFQLDYKESGFLRRDRVQLPAFGARLGGESVLGATDQASGASSALLDRFTGGASGAFASRAEANLASRSSLGPQPGDRAEVSLLGAVNLDFGFGPIGLSGRATRNVDNTWVKSVTLSRSERIAGVNLAASVGLTEINGKSDFQGVLTLSRPFGPVDASASIDQDGNTSFSSSYRRGDSGIGALDAQVDARTTEGLTSLDARTRYIANRFELQAGHRSQNIGAAQSKDVSTLRIDFGLGATDSAIAIGRPVDAGFVIAKPHPTLKDVQLTIASPGGTPIARTGKLGPALAPLSGQSYQNAALGVQAPDLPAGYDLGASDVRFAPGFKSGFVATIGSDAALTVLGVLETADAKPLVLRAGWLRNASGENVAQFFTNRAGRFVAERVPAGSYEIVLAPEQSTGVTVTVPRDAVGLFDAGVLRLKD